jgi:hypothetical protein
MSELQHELNDLKGFIADLKADRAAAKEKERREAWTKYVTLSVVIVAVFAAIATQWSGKYSSRTLARLNDATFYQAKASDQWSFYQAKSIKQNLYEVNRPRAARNGEATEETAALQLKEFEDKIAKYEKEKKDIMDEARKLEAQRDEARGLADLASQKGGAMGLAVAIFSIGIAMSSICMVTKKKPLWFISLVMSAFAVEEMVRVWLS